MEEQWKPIEGYEGIYEVSSIGRVRSLDRYDRRGIFRKSQIIKTKRHPEGYRSVSLWSDGKQTPLLVHRLVAQAFLPNPDNLPDVNHKDEDKTNNRADNLEWCTKEYNCNYGQHHEKQKAALAHWMHRVTQLTLDGQPVATYPSVSAAARAVGVTCKAIRLCISGKHKHCKGYQWRYTDE